MALRASGLAINEVASVVALGSPFLVGEPLSVKKVTNFWRQLIGAIVCGGLLLFGVRSFLLDKSIIDLPPESPMWLEAISFVALMAALSTIGVGSEWLARLVARLHSQRGRALIERYSGFGTAFVSTLPIYYRVVDEAYGVIRGSLRIRPFLVVLQKRGVIIADGLLRRLVAFALPICLLTLAADWLLPIPVVVNTMYWLSGIASVATLIVMFILPAWAFATSFHMLTPMWTTMLAFGSDSASASLFLRLSVIQRPHGECVAPDFIPTLETNWRDSATSWLRHSHLCFDPRAIRAVGRWLATTR